MAFKNCLKAERIFYVVLVFVTIAFMLWYFLKPSQGNVVEVRVSGKVVGTYLLNKNKEVTIEGKAKGKNILVIRNGKATIEEADCPDALCVRKGKVCRVSESIICLPHEVVVEIKKKDLGNEKELSEQREENVDVIAK